MCPGFPAMEADLDLLEAEARITHNIQLADPGLKAQTELDIFRPDPDFDTHQEQWQVTHSQSTGCGPLKGISLEPPTVCISSACCLSPGAIVHWGYSRRAACIPAAIHFQTANELHVQVRSECLQCKAKP